MYHIFILDVSITHIESYIISFHVYKKHDRTPHLDPSDFETEDLLSILSRNLPDDPHDYIFGKSIDGKDSLYIIYTYYIYKPQKLT